MLAIFHKQVACAPQELHSPDASKQHHPPAPTRRHPKSPDDILRDFQAAHPAAFSANFSSGASLAFTTGGGSPRRPLFCAVDEVYCLFAGALDNLSALVRQYGICGRSANEALLVIEAYRTLRDRGPYPADQVLRDLVGSFAFVLFDNKSASVFAAVSADGGVPLQWGVAADGSVVISDDRATVKGGCGKSHAAFPAGCMFHSEGGLRSFEHPMNRVTAVPRVDSDGAMCGAEFQVDAFSKVSAIPRVGSAANWTGWDHMA